MNFRLSNQKSKRITSNWKIGLKTRILVKGFYPLESLIDH
jgi:hypothetical protein